jgi:hypothetical protein
LAKAGQASAESAANTARVARFTEGLARLQLEEALTLFASK